MSKKSIFIILFIMLMSVGIISLYSTFAYDEENAKLDESSADYNLIYSIKESSKNQLSVVAKETKYADITLKNDYTANIKYGMYYHLLSPNKLPENVTITLASESASPLEDIIKPNETKIVTIKIINNSENNIDIIIGAVVGFENGNIKELIKNNEIIIR